VSNDENTDNKENNNPNANKNANPAHKVAVELVILYNIISVDANLLYFSS